MLRNRTTWTPKVASPPPAMPSEGVTHPAGSPDPAADAYENGNTSTWAEDPSKAPVRTSPAPANPVDDGGYRHPAAQPGAPAKNAGMTMEAAEKRASLCVKIASAMLGAEISKEADAGDKFAEQMIADQALDMMDLPDSRLASLFRRIEAATLPVEVLQRRMASRIAGEDEPEEEEEAEESGKTAALDLKLAELSSQIQALQGQLAAFSPTAAPAPSMVADDPEAMLADMLSEEAAKASAPVAPMADDTEAMLAGMLAEQPMPAVAVSPLMDMVADPMEISLDAPEDPMGLMDDSGMNAEDDALLSSLFAGHTAGEEAPEEEEVKKEEKKASAKPAPQPRTASATPARLGSQARVASQDNNDLSNLWGSAPDVKNIFS